MNAELLTQLAHTNLLPSAMSTAILAGDEAPTEDVVMALLILAQDAEAMISGDPESTWNERRIARLGLSVAFLSALALTRETGSK